MLRTIAINNTVSNPVIYIPPCKHFQPLHTLYASIRKNRPLCQLFLTQQRRTQASMVQQHPADKNPLFVHKALNSRPAPVLIVPTVYLLGYFRPGAGPMRVLSLLARETAFQATNGNKFQQEQGGGKKSLTMTALYPFTTAFQGFTYIDANIHTPIKALSIVDTQVSHFLVPQSLQLGPDTVYSIKTSTAALLKV